MNDDTTMYHPPAPEYGGFEGRYAPVWETFNAVDMPVWINRLVTASAVLIGLIAAWVM